jgi:hypothetical protein
MPWSQDRQGEDGSAGLHASRGMSAGLLLYQQSTERNAHSTVLGYGMREATNVAHACLVRWFSEGGGNLSGGHWKRWLFWDAVISRGVLPKNVTVGKSVRRGGFARSLSLCHAGVGARLVRRNATGIGICETDPYMTSAKPNVKRERHGGRGGGLHLPPGLQPLADLCMCSILRPTVFCTSSRPLSRLSLLPGLSWGDFLSTGRRGVSGIRFRLQGAGRTYLASQLHHRPIAIILSQTTTTTQSSASHPPTHSPSLAISTISSPADDPVVLLEKY